MRRLKTLACVVLCIGAALCQPPANKDIETRNTIGQLCGEFSHVDSRTAAKDSGTLEKTTPLAAITLRVYARGKLACCADLVPLAEEKSGADGQFTFKSVKPGSYWLVALVAGREYKLSFQLRRPTNSSPSCSHQKFEIDDFGDFRLIRLVGHL